MRERQYDIIAFGATGFTGGLTASYLARHAPPGTRWAVAGRREGALEALRARLEGEPCPPSGLVVADSAEAATLRAMAARTRVVLTTVGPFIRYGEPLVRACVEAGTDYLDITGEPRFVERMIDRYHVRAERRGVKVVPCCGFDSVPHDLGVLFTLDHLSGDGPRVVEGFVRSRGALSGGTWHSAIEAMATLSEHRRERRRRPRPATPPGREVRGLRPRLRWEPAVGAWAVPLPTIDPQVVLRSARLRDDYGRDFRYGHYARVRRLGTVVGGALAVGGIVALAQLRPTRELLLRARRRGEGPSEAERARGFFRVTFLARAGAETVRTEVAGGDAGDTETSKMLAESALCLAFSREATPPIAGVVTPASGMGHALLGRLKAAGISFRRLEPR